MTPMISVPVKPAVTSLCSGGWLRQPRRAGVLPGSGWRGMSTFPWSMSSPGSTGEIGNRQDRSWAARSRFACSCFSCHCCSLWSGSPGSPLASSLPAQSAGLLVYTAASGRRSARLFTSLGSRGGLRCCSACSGW